MNQEVVTVTVAILGFLILWGGTIAGVVIWLNSKFNQLVPIQSYEEKHLKLEERVRSIELWRAGQNRAQ